MCSKRDYAISIINVNTTLLFQVSHLSTKRALEDSIENRLIQFQRRQQAMATSIIPSLLIEDFNVIPNKGTLYSLIL